MFTQLHCELEYQSILFTYRDVSLGSNNFRDIRDNGGTQLDSIQCWVTLGYFLQLQNKAAHMIAVSVQKKSQAKSDHV